jgi:hypothetical protein
VAPARPDQYFEIAQQLLFSKDRNSTVILDPPAAPPPPKPIPAFPLAYGVMNLGSGPMIILSEKAGAPHRSYKAGEKIGEFTLVAMNNYELVLEWEGKYIKKRIEDLAARKSTIPQQSASEEKPAEAAVPSGPAATSLGGAAKSGPGTELGNQSRACVAGDTAPAGTVQDGLRKVVTKTPFGESCRWEPAK